MRQHYVTLCTHGNTIVTYMRVKDEVQVTFEQARSRGFNTVVMNLDGTILSSEGFESAEVDYFQRFLSRNRAAIAEGAMRSA